MQKLQRNLLQRQPKMRRKLPRSADPWLGRNMGAGAALTVKFVGCKFAGKASKQVAVTAA